MNAPLLQAARRRPIWSTRSTRPARRHRRRHAGARRAPDAGGDRPAAGGVAPAGAAGAAPAETRTVSARRARPRRAGGRHAHREPAPPPSTRCWRARRAGGLAAQPCARRSMPEADRARRKSDARAQRAGHDQGPTAAFHRRLRGIRQPLIARSLHWAHPPWAPSLQRCRDRRLMAAMWKASANHQRLLRHTGWLRQIAYSCLPQISLRRTADHPVACSTSSPPPHIGDDASGWLS